MNELGLSILDMLKILAPYQKWLMNEINHHYSCDEWEFDIDQPYKDYTYRGRLKNKYNEWYGDGLTKEAATLNTIRAYERESGRQMGERSQQDKLKRAQTERAMQALGASGLSLMGARKLTEKEWLIDADRRDLSDSEMEFLADLTGVSVEWIRDGVEDHRVAFLKQYGILK